MSWNVIQQVIKYSKAKSADRLVLFIIAHHINDRTGVTWLSNLTLVQETQLSRRQVIYSIKSLEASGELFVKRSRGRGHAQMYEIPDLIGAISAPISEEEKVQSATLKGANNVIKGANSDHKRCTGCTPSICSSVVRRICQNMVECAECGNLHQEGKCLMESYGE